MSLKDGMVYAGEQESSITVKAVKVISDMIMLVTFSNGEARVFDAAILDGEVFEPLKDRAVFENPVIDHGVVTWSNGNIDCAPEYMFKNSYEYKNI